MSAAQPGFAVVGRHLDGSGLSEDVYGPYAQERADQVAQALNGGMWQGMTWRVLPLKLTPWEPTHFTVNANPLASLFTTLT